MPIELSEFEKGKEPTAVKGSTVRPEVEKFMAENDDQAYTTKEVADAIKANKATVNHTLRKLLEEAKIERKSSGGLIYNHWIGGEPNADKDDDK